MKRKEVRELISKTKEELMSKLQELKKDREKMHVERGAHRLQNTATIGQKKKDIARILTVLKQKELETK